VTSWPIFRQRPLRPLLLVDCRHSDKSVSFSRKWSFPTGGGSALNGVLFRTDRDMVLAQWQVFPNLSRLRYEKVARKQDDMRITVTLDEV
jgi:hypothetical protein